MSTFYRINIERTGGLIRWAGYAIQTGGSMKVTVEGMHSKIKIKAGQYAGKKAKFTSSRILEL